MEDSWRQQPGTPCYAADLDPPRLKEALAAAYRGRLPEYCGKADERCPRVLRAAAVAVVHTVVTRPLTASLLNNTE